MAVGCSDESFTEQPTTLAPASVGGSYTMQLVNGENGCGFKNWKQGDVTSDVQLTVTQTDAKVVATIDPSLTAAYLQLVLGTSTFTGTASETSLLLQAIGNNVKQKTCELRWTMVLDGAVNEQGFTGKLTLRPEITVQTDDCEQPAGCASVLSVSALRKD